jgi:esterase
MQLNYKELGQGQPLVILHGLLGSLDNWMTLAKKYAEKYHVFLIDQRNHGKSDWSEEWNYEVMSQDVAEFVETHQLENMILMGHSMGGKTAMWYATQFPDKVAKLVIVDKSPRWYAVTHDKIVDTLLGMDIANMTSRNDADAYLTPYFPDFGMRQFLLKNLDRDSNNQFVWKANLKVIRKNMDIVGEALPKNTVFEKPTLFIRGSKSDYILDSDKDLIQKHFPQYQLATIEAGHWLHAENPKAFLEATLSFF